tara:strand:+ start:145 stop:663 length:519 start_codon:yes stop_codon:yes gene_type:complete
MLKIIAGRFKGAAIKTMSSLNYRPTKSNVRTSVFDMLSTNKYLDVLDLFSGTGILGFEAASRGSENITFVENDFESFNLIKENSKLFDSCTLQFHKDNVFSFLKQTTLKYDLILADPPYLIDKEDIVSLYNSCVKLLNNNGKLILEMSSKNKFNFEGKIKKYGSTSVLIYSN